MEISWRSEEMWTSAPWIWLVRGVKISCNFMIPAFILWFMLSYKLLSCSWRNEGLAVEPHTFMQVSVLVQVSQSKEIVVPPALRIHHEEESPVRLLSYVSYVCRYWLSAFLTSCRHRCSSETMESTIKSAPRHYEPGHQRRSLHHCESLKSHMWPTWVIKSIYTGRIDTVSHLSCIDQTLDSSCGHKHPPVIFPWISLFSLWKKP